MQRRTRREFLAATGAASAALWLGACGGGGGSGGGAEGELTFVTWGGPAELDAFNALIQDFEEQNSGARIKLQEVPFAEVRQTVDAGLEAGDGPDLFRVTYNDFGFYASQNALVDLSEYLPADYGDDFIAALWDAVQFEGAPYGVPHHTDVSAIVYNRQLFEEAGIGAVPERLEDAWSWDEFLDVARQLRDAQSGQRRAFGMNWQGAGAYRWLNWLYAAGGSLYNDSVSQVTVDSPEALRTLEYFKTWFDEGLVPNNTTPKSTTYVDELFPSRTVGMLSAGDFLLPVFEENVQDFEYGATFLPQDASAATDLGGNTVVATRIGQNPELAAQFLEFLASERSMRRFCETTGVLPTRNSLVEADLDYKVRPDLMPVFTQQATTLTPAYVRAVTVPGFTELNNAFVDGLEGYLVNDRSPDETLRAIAEAANEAIEG
jgi:ABC-type glycerol-3-phosphate transport system substrate-binding protein